MQRMAAHVSLTHLSLSPSPTHHAMPSQMSERAEDTINDMALPSHDEEPSAASRKRKYEENDASTPSLPHYPQWTDEDPSLSIAAPEGGQVKVEHQAIDEQEAALMKKEAAASKNAIYLANMTWFTTDAEVEKLCSEFGQLVNLRFIEDRFNGKSKVPYPSKTLCL